MRKIKTKNESSSKSTNKNLIVRTVVKTSLFTFWITICFLSFTMLALSAVLPTFAIKVYDKLGCEKTSYNVYQRVYERTHTLESLYNVLQVSITMEDYNNTERYARLMIKDNKFQDFAKKIDEATKSNLEKKYSIYADSYKSYVYRHLVIALYKTDRKEEAKMLAIDSIYENAEELFVFVQLVREDEHLSAKEINKNLETLYSRYGLKQALIIKQNELDPEVYTETYEKIIVYEQKIKIAEIQYYISGAAGDEIGKEEAKGFLASWNFIVDDLIKSL